MKKSIEEIKDAAIEYVDIKYSNCVYGKYYASKNGFIAGYTRALEEMQEQFIDVEWKLEVAIEAMKSTANDLHKSDDPHVDALNRLDEALTKIRCEQKDTDNE